MVAYLCLINMVMIRRLLSFFLFMIACGTVAQEESAGRITVSGEIKDREGAPVSYAHILIKARNEGTVGDYYGRFAIPAFPGDTLTISAISYHDINIIIPSGFLLRRYPVAVFMSKDTVNLKEVLIHPWPATLEKLKEEVLNIEIRDPVSENITPYLPTPQELKALAHPPGAIVAMPGPFSLLYDRFSKEAKQKKAYAGVMKQEMASKKYNMTLVSLLTGLKSEPEILKFIDFCALEIDFILRATEYELYAAIIECYHDYCNLHPGVPPD